MAGSLSTLGTQEQDICERGKEYDKFGLKH